MYCCETPLQSGRIKKLGETYAKLLLGRRLFILQLLEQCDDDSGRLSSVDGLCQRPDALAQCLVVHFAVSVAVCSLRNFLSQWLAARMLKGKAQLASGSSGSGRRRGDRKMSRGTGLSKEGRPSVKVSEKPAKRIKTASGYGCSEEEARPMGVELEIIEGSSGGLKGGQVW